MSLEDDTISGNMGLLDQQAALGWVRANVDSFYGDAGRVTVAGQSAGGMAAVAHMVSPGAKGLFDQVLVFNRS